MALPGYSADRQERPAFSTKLCCQWQTTACSDAQTGSRRGSRALAEALRASGVPEEASAELLSNASAAVLQALRLEVLVQHPELIDKPGARLAA